VTCREFADFIADYFSNELAAEIRARFDRHLQLCPNCRRYLRSYQESVTLAKATFSTDQSPVPADVPEQLVQAILDARRRSR
jgi:anti-sigma factor RsiW